MEIYAIERKNRILSQLQQRGRVEVSRLADELNVSKETLRKDLRELEAENLLSRVHGGAVPVKEQYLDKQRSAVYREQQHREEKIRICKKAAALVRDQDTIFIDNSSTNYNLVRYIDPKLHVTIITNSVKVLMDSAYLDPNNFTFISVGGIFRKEFFSLVGEPALSAVNSYHPNITFLSCFGIGKEGILYDISIYETDIKKAAMSIADRVVLTADHTKMGVAGGALLSTLNNVDDLITDIKPGTAELECLKSCGTALILADE